MHDADIQPDRQFCTVMPDDRKSAFDVREPSVAASDYAGLASTLAPGAS